MERLHLPVTDEYANLISLSNSVSGVLDGKTVSVSDAITIDELTI